jgi:hypothetical protein
MRVGADRNDIVRCYQMCKRGGWDPAAKTGSWEHPMAQGVTKPKWTREMLSTWVHARQDSCTLQQLLAAAVAG